jgi:hypothetical protein
MFRLIIFNAASPSSGWSPQVSNENVGEVLVGLEFPRRLASRRAGKSALAHHRRPRIQRCTRVRRPHREEAEWLSTVEPRRPSKAPSRV